MTCWKAYRMAAGRLVLLVGLLFNVSIAIADEPESEPNLLLLEVRLDQSVLSDAIPALEVGEHTLLPLGELSRLLTIGVQTQSQQGTASGFIVSKERSFSLNLSEGRVTLAGKHLSFDPALVLAEPDDLYVAVSLLERWLPVTFEVDRPRLALRVHSLEPLPLQARLQRERAGERASGHGTYVDPGYPRHDVPYQVLSTPFIDQTLATETRSDAAGTQIDSRYTALLTGDLLGMESTLYFNHDSAGEPYELRGTFGRNDPDGELLGPLQARSFQFGSLSTQSVDNVTSGRFGEGITLSNRQLTRPTQFDRQTFEGDLPPGWDVELFYNGALVGFQQTNAEGRYRFEDQPLSYGRNDFQLVFHGPLGQTQTERYSYSLAESMVLPGEFQYSLTEHRDEEGRARSIAQFDLGLSRSLSATGGFIRAPVDGVDHRYSSIGLRTFWQSMSLNTEMIKDQEGGSLTEFGLQTSLGGVAIDASRLFLKDFKSDYFSFDSDPIKTRDELRLTGSIPVGFNARMPISLQATRDEHESGRIDNDVSARISAYAYRTALSNTLNWRTIDGHEFTFGDFQVSRRIRDMSFRGQVGYILGSQPKVSVAALTADKYLAEGYRLTFGVTHSFQFPETRYTAGFTKSLGRFGLGVNTSYLDSGDIAVGMQLFLSLGRDPRSSGWLLDAQPMANTGAASVRMFLDENNNGLKDEGEDPIEGAGFTVNGGGRQVRTDAKGIAHIGRLPIKQRVDIGVDTGTLTDPQWAPSVAGQSLVPRPGRVAEFDIPVRMTTEIDGTVYLLEQGEKRGIGDLQLELLDKQMQIVGRTTSSWDGFYIIPGVVAGEYLLRLSPEQLDRLELTDTGTMKITVSGDGAFVSGVDMMVRPSHQAESKR
jgi:hypothetical protein